MTRPARLSAPACVLFDLDGTLLDTAPDLGHAANLVRAETGLPPLPLVDYRPVASTGARGLLKVALDLTPEHPDYPTHRDSLLAHYRAGISRHTRPFPGMAELLVNLEVRGIRWGVVTNKPGWLTQPLMQELDLANRAACIVSGDTCAKAKPAPDPLMHACAQIGLKPKECVYVGDDPRDVEAARAAKMRSIAAGWGYLGSDTPIDAWGADFITPTVTDLANLLS